jgi:hypothetical protein
MTALDLATPAASPGTRRKTGATPPLDLQFHPFGAYFVLGKGKTTAHGQFWICQCACNKQVEIHADALIDGRATSCGCTYRDPLGRRKSVRKAYQDLTGQQFQQYLVLQRAPSPPRSPKTWWHCRCTCGHLTSHNQQRLVSGEVTQCGTCNGKAISRVKLHRWYGVYFVLARVANTAKGAPQYQCRCYLCERVKILRGVQLHNAARCDCGQRPGADSFLHQRVGRWQVLAFAGFDKNDFPLYRCQCTCAAQTLRNVRAFSLLKGESKSCGCLQRKDRPPQQPKARERQAHGQTAPGRTLVQNSAQAFGVEKTRDAVADLAVEPEIPKAEPSTTAAADPSPTAEVVPEPRLDFVVLADRATDALQACLAAVADNPEFIPDHLDALHALWGACEDMVEVLEESRSLAVAMEAAMEPEPAPAPPVPTKPVREDTVIMRVWRFVQEHQPCTNAQVRQALEIPRNQAFNILKMLVKQGKVRKDGEQYLATTA